MPPPREHFEAVLLERSGAKRSLPEEQHPGLVKERVAEVLVPAAPAFESVFGQGGVRLVGSILQPDHLADVRGGRERMGQGARIEKLHPVAAPPQLQRRGQSEDSGAEDDDALHLSPGTATRCGCRGSATSARRSRRARPRSTPSRTREGSPRRRYTARSCP